MPATLAQEALDTARDAQRNISAHEDLCAERYRHINTSIDEMKSIMKWAGSLIITLLIAVLGWSISQQFAANEAQMKQLADQQMIWQSRMPPTPPAAPGASR